jgi:hypothetical protein
VFYAKYNFRLRLPFKNFLVSNNFQFLPLNFADPNGVFAIIGTSETLICQANEQLMWWSKDNKNITKTDTRYVKEKK